MKYCWFAKTTSSMTPETAMTSLEEHCNQTVLNQPPLADGRLYCPALWDSWGCWNYTLAGTAASIPCPAFIKGFDESLRAYRVCKPDGTWWVSPTNNTWANYTSCINQDELNKDKRQTILFISGYSISIAFLFLALIIFTAFRQLHCDRVTIHKNLFSSYIINGSMWILYYRLVAWDYSVQRENPLWCRFLNVITQYTVQCNFFWMFCEGFYLYSIIMNGLVACKKLLIACHVIGWGLPLFFTILYASFRSEQQDETNRCWAQVSRLQWIIATPIVLSIIVNVIFLCYIMRVLISKLRTPQSPDTTNYRKAAKAILVLVPLLGIQYILFPIKIAGKGAWQEVYLYIVAFVTSFQGLFVSCLFCFCNGEVCTVVMRRWRQRRMMAHDEIKNDSFAVLTLEEEACKTKDGKCCCINISNQTEMR